MYNEMMVYALASMQQVGSIAFVVIGVLFLFSVLSVSSFMRQWLYKRVIQWQLMQLIVAIQCSDTGADLNGLGSKRKKSEIIELTQACYMALECSRQVTLTAQQDNDKIKRSLEASVHIVAAKAASGDRFLEMIARLSRLIGCFGTVCALLQYLSGALALEMVSIASLVSGITSALLTTAVGLAVAVPAMFFSFVLSNQSEQCKLLCEKVIWHVQARSSMML